MIDSEQPFVSLKTAREQLRTFGRKDITIPNSMEELHGVPNPDEPIAVQGPYPFDGDMPIVKFHECRYCIRQGSEPIYSQPHENIGGVVLAVGPKKLVGAVALPEVVEAEFVNRTKTVRIECRWLHEKKCWVLTRMEWDRV